MPIDQRVGPIGTASAGYIHITSNNADGSRSKHNSWNATVKVRSACVSYMTGNIHDGFYEAQVVR